ncbi:MAG: MMPL family transporter [Phycisphaera sp.]|nr:MMPL family transporter [Phycisphaera sp.]
MDLIRFSISKPVTVSVGVLLVLLAGMISLGLIPIQLTPNLETTTISVRTTWEGASPQDIEREIVQRQEDKLKNISGLEKMTSTCNQGEGEITLEFGLDIPKEVALREASDRLREVSQYPENVDEPIVRATNPADRDYIAWVVVTCTDPNFDVRELQDFFEEDVKPELERTKNVSEVNVLGGFEREVQVQVDPVAMAQRGISYEMLVSKLRAQNANASAGRINEGKRDVPVRAIGRYERVEEIENTLLSAPGEPVVKVKDVCRAVELAYKEPARIVRSRGERVLAFNAQREVGSNVIQVMKDYEDKIEWVKQNMLPAEARRLHLNGEIKLEKVYDQTVYIDQALELVNSNLYVGGSLAIAVLLIFLWSVRSTLVIALAIPISVIGTFTAMTMMGRNINVISLAGLAFAVGMVVDNAIVVLENIDRHRKLGQDAASAAYKATKEVWGAILASTLTTVAVFIPVLTIKEEAGQMFRDISLAICAAVSLSLIVSITVIPAAAARLLGNRKAAPPSDDATAKKPHMFGLSNMLGLRPLFAGLTQGFSRLLLWMMTWPAVAWSLRPAIIIAMTGLSVWLSYVLMPPSSYLPTGNRNLVFAMLFPPPGYNLDQKESLGMRIEPSIKPYWDAYLHPDAHEKLPPIPMYNMMTGETHMEENPPAVANFFFVAIGDRLFMGAISADGQRVAPVGALVNNTVRDLPGVRGFATQMPLFRTAAIGSGGGILIEVVGPNLDEVSAAAELLLPRLMAKFGRVTPTPSNFDKPGLEVRVTRSDVKDAAAADVGLSQRDINTAVQVLGDGMIIGDYLYHGDTIDLKVRAYNSESGNAEYMRELPLATSSDRIVTLDSVRDVTRSVAPQQITRVEEQRAVTLELNLSDEYPLELAMADIDTEIQAMRNEGLIPPTVRTNMAGTAAKLKEVRRALLGEWHKDDTTASLYNLITSRMFLALVVVFLLMAALFESWFYPLVIMFSVPLATVGGFIGLDLVQRGVPGVMIPHPEQQLDVLTMLGFVILIGIVVNNAILIVHQALNLMRGEADVQMDGDITHKLPPHEAIAESVRTRVRPIFMTMFTSVGGMLPLVLFPGAGSELYRGLGSVVVGGLMVSTIFTLVLVPLLLSIVFDLGYGLRAVASKVGIVEASKPDAA